MEQETLSQIAISLDRISKTLAGLLLRDLEEQDQSKKIFRLGSCGFSNAEIAEILGTTDATVRVARNRLRKTKKPTK